MATTAKVANMENCSGCQLCALVCSFARMTVYAAKNYQLARDEELLDGFPLDRGKARRKKSLTRGRKPHPCSINLDSRLRIGQLLDDLSVTEVDNIYSPSPLRLSLVALFY